MRFPAAPCPVLRPGTSAPRRSVPPVPATAGPKVPEAFIEAAISQLPSDTFALVIDGQSVQHGKPDPEPYRTAAQRLGFLPADCLAIEDSEPGYPISVSGRRADAGSDQTPLSHKVSP